MNEESELEELKDRFNKWLEEVEQVKEEERKRAIEKVEELIS